MIKMRAAFAGVLAGMIALFTFTGSAEAAPAPVRSVASVCETGGRESAEYRRKCMTLGTVADAAGLWYGMPRAERRQVCATAHQFGGIRPAVREVFFDVAYDNYLRHTYVLRWAGTFAAHDCRAMGYRV